MDALIELLANGEFHAGDELGGMLGITRAGVWKQVQKLQLLGLDVQSVKGKGYRLAQPVEMLNADAIRQGLEPEAKRLLSVLEVKIQATSTNDVAMSRALDGAGSGFVCMAEYQTAGRGRRGRQWVSPFASNLYMSCIWEFFHGAAALEGLSLATGVAVVEALATVGVQGATLKWPNDILINGSKLAGILLEMTGDPSGRCQVVIGVGINHRMPVKAGGSIDQSWTRLDEHCAGIARNELASAVLSKVLQMLEAFQHSGFASFREKWLQLDAFHNRAVVVKTGAVDVEGVAEGVDATGGLRVRTGTGIEIMKGGELSLRLSS